MSKVSVNFVWQFKCPLQSSVSNFVNCFFMYFRLGEIQNQSLRDKCSTTGASSIDTSSSNEWTTAFYITRVDKIRAILDHGQPLPIGKNSHQKNTFILRKRVNKMMISLPLMQNHAKMLMEIKKTIQDREPFSGSAHHRMHRWKLKQSSYSDLVPCHTTLRRPLKCASVRNRFAWPMKQWAWAKQWLRQTTPQTQRPQHLRRSRIRRPIQWFPFGRRKRPVPVYCRHYFSNSRPSQPMPKRLNKYHINLLIK